MDKIELIMGIALLVFGVILTVLVLAQTGKDKRLSGTIAGSSETFFGKSKSAGNEKKLTIATTVIAVIFCALVLVLYFVAGK